MFFVLGISTAVAEVAAIPGVHDRQHPARTVKEWLSQGEAQNNQPAEVVQVTGVKANPTDKGVEVILQTLKGQQLPVVNRSADNSYIADIPNAQLRLPSGEAFVFRSQKPITGITEITVTNADANTIRVTVTGEAGAPTVELFDSPEEGLIFAIASAAASTPQGQPPQTQPTLPSVEPENETQPGEPSVEGEEEINILVTGEQEETGYSVPNSSTVTRTDTPLRDIPQSIQIIPQEVLRDQRADIPSALINAPSVRTSSPTNFDSVRIQFRGFFSTSTLNGFKDTLSSNLDPDLTGIDRIEVLQGPNSIRFS